MKKGHHTHISTRHGHKTWTEHRHNGQHGTGDTAQHGRARKRRKGGACEEWNGKRTSKVNESQNQPPARRAGPAAGLCSAVRCGAGAQPGGRGRVPLTPCAARLPAAGRPVARRVLVIKSAVLHKLHITNRQCCTRTKGRSEQPHHRAVLRISVACRAAPLMLGGRPARAKISVRGARGGRGLRPAPPSPLACTNRGGRACINAPAQPHLRMPDGSACKPPVKAPQVMESQVLRVRSGRAAAGAAAPSCLHAMRFRRVEGGKESKVVETIPALWRAGAIGPASACLRTRGWLAALWAGLPLTSGQQT